jgi:hypothetical protein
MQMVRASFTGGGEQVPWRIEAPVDFGALGSGSLKSGTGGDFTFGHRSGTFGLNVGQVLNSDPNKIPYSVLNFPRTACISCDGAVYIKQARPADTVSWIEADGYIASSFFTDGDSIQSQR